MTAIPPVVPEPPTTNLPRYWPEPLSPVGKRVPVVAGTTIAGGRIAGGRIRLLIFYGESPHLQFWQAADTLTGQHLAVTVVDSENALPRATVDAILADT